MSVTAIMPAATEPAAPGLENTGVPVVEPGAGGTFDDLMRGMLLPQADTEASNPDGRRFAKKGQPLVPETAAAAPDEAPPVVPLAPAPPAAAEADYAWLALSSAPAVPTDEADLVVAQPLDASYSDAEPAGEPADAAMNSESGMRLPPSERPDATHFAPEADVATGGAARPIPAAEAISEPQTQAQSAGRPAAQMPILTNEPAVRPADASITAPPAVPTSVAAPAFPPDSAIPMSPADAAPVQPTPAFMPTPIASVADMPAGAANPVVSSAPTADFDFRPAAAETPMAPPPVQMAAVPPPVPLPVAPAPAAGPAPAVTLVETPTMPIMPDAPVVEPQGQPVPVVEVQSAPAAGPTVEPAFDRPPAANPAEAPIAGAAAQPETAIAELVAPPASERPVVGNASVAGDAPRRDSAALTAAPIVQPAVQPPALPRRRSAARMTAPAMAGTADETAEKAAAKTDSAPTVSRHVSAESDLGADDGREEDSTGQRPSAAPELRLPFTPLQTTAARAANSALSAAAPAPAFSQQLQGHLERALVRVERLHELVERFDEHVIRLAAGRDKAMTITIVPESLGAVTIRCREAGDRVAVEIVAENQVVRNLLQQQEAPLRQALEDSGYKLGAFDVRTSADGGTSDPGARGRPSAESGEEDAGAGPGRAAGRSPAADAAVAPETGWQPADSRGIWMVA